MIDLEKVKILPVATSLRDDEVDIIDRTAVELSTTRSGVLRSMIRFVLENPEHLKSYAEEIQRQQEEINAFPE